jgi:glycerol-3-phosphate acyltransferase PlsX
MRIGIDAMGGDHAPAEIVRGAALGLEHLSASDELVLFGPQEAVAAECRRMELTDARMRIEPCAEVIDMRDSPVEALRLKRDSSIVRLASAAGKGELDAVLSAGNTGAFVAACQLRVKPIKGVTRPGIAVVVPTFHGPVLMCDVGANVAPKPHHLHDYARMCTIYAREILKVKQPKVAIISVGEEERKGNALVKEAHALMKGDRSLHFIGNVEGRDILAGVAHVFICDGFVGNVVLKLIEGLAEGLFATIQSEIQHEAAQLAGQFRPIVERIWKRHDFAEYGGAPLLGIKSVAIICHGRSDRRAISNGVRVAVEQIRKNLNAAIENHLSPSDEAA